MRANFFMLEENVPSTVDVFPVPKQAEPSESHEHFEVVHGIPEQKKDLYTIGEQHWAPLMRVISSGGLSTYISNRGSGYLAFESKSVTHWNNDPTFDALGSYIYVRETEKMRGAEKNAAKSDEKSIVWSATYQPTKTKQQPYVITHTEHAAQFNSTQNDIAMQLQIRHLPGYAIELRTLALTNVSKRSRIVEVFSYNEIALAPEDEFRAHPSFSKMHVVGTVMEGRNALLFHRLMLKSQQSLWFGHAVLMEGLEQDSVRYQTDRMRFIGRLGSAAAPKFEMDNREAVQKNPYGLDPIASIGVSVRLNPNETKQLYFLNAVSHTHAETESLIHAFPEVQTIEKFLSTVTKIESSAINIADPVNMLTSQQLLSCLLFKRGIGIAAFSGNWQESVSKLGVDSSLPTITIEMNSKSSEIFLSQLLEYVYRLADGGFIINLIIVVFDTDGYFKPVFTQIQEIIWNFEIERGVETPEKPKVFILQNSNLTAQQYSVLFALSQLSLNATIDSFERQIESEFTSL